MAVYRPQIAKPHVLKHTAGQQGLFQRLFYPMRKPIFAGFPKPCESVHDAFIAGHASNSVAVALGMARARTLLNEDTFSISSRRSWAHKASPS